jgi:formylglycine-generating enzyme required for sulfatase activity/uncharacterized caspase-like protein
MCALVPALAEKRVALVIGNAAYRHADKLANPANDARGVRDALKRLGFDVTYGEDLDGQKLRERIGQFAEAVEEADVAVVYFAGHGATFSDTPYVVPVDATFKSLERVPYELVPVETLIGELRRAKGVRIAILDACRDNAAERVLKRQTVTVRGGEVTRGLAPMKNADGKNPEGLILAYATQYLSTAADDAGTAPGGPFSWLSSSARHSPFTAALLNNIATPGLDVKDMFYKVGRDVIASTGGRQRPEISISMYDQYILTPASGGAVAASPAAGPAADEMAWSIVKDAANAEQLRRFIAQFPASPRRREAEERIKTLEQTNVAALQARPQGPAGTSPSLAPPINSVPAAAPAFEPPKPAAGQQIAVVAPPVTPATPAAGPCGGVVTVSSSSSRCAPLTAAQERGLKPKDSFRECENCPEMVVVPAGRFTMGSPNGEKDRLDNEDPQHVVMIGRPFAVAKLHVTHEQYAAFVQKTGYQASSKCDDGLVARAGLSWRNPGFAQEGSHPVVCVSWDSATAYVNWMARETGKPYRLLSEAEWEYAARGRTSPGSYPRFWFGNDEKDLCRYGNFGDQLAWDKPGPCNDGYAKTSPAGHYEPNAFGLYDMFGNADQWTADCWHDNYVGAPSDGSAWITGTCPSRVIRGGSWLGSPRFARAAQRFRYLAYSAEFDSVTIGFRVARSLTP